MAYYLTNAVGNTTTDNIVIVDTKGNLLYGAKTDNTLGGTISGTEDYKAKLQQTFSERTEKMLLKPAMTMPTAARQILNLTWTK